MNDKIVIIQNFSCYCTTKLIVNNFINNTTKIKELCGYLVNVAEKSTLPTSVGMYVTHVASECAHFV